MLTLVNSQPEGTIYVTGTCIYTATLSNQYDRPISKLEVQIALSRYFGNCTIGESQMYISNIAIAYPSPDNTVPPGASVVVSATITTHNAPGLCYVAGFFFPPVIQPTITVRFQLGDDTDTFSADMTPFKIIPKTPSSDEQRP